MPPPPTPADECVAMARTTTAKLASFLTAMRFSPTPKFDEAIDIGGSFIQPDLWPHDRANTYARSRVRGGTVAQPITSRVEV